jgi:hypothetical protein
MGEAVYSIIRAHRIRQEALRSQGEGHTTHRMDSKLTEAELFSRYAFLLASNALENCAHSILANSEKLSSSLLEDIDKIGTINKFEIFALIHGSTVNRGDGRYSKIREVIKCRNAFVHPKNLMVPVESDGVRGIPRVVGNRNYPLAFEFMEIEQVAHMIGDILRFISWVVFDVCKYKIEEAPHLISDDSQWWMNDLEVGERLWGYDFRSFGDVRYPKTRSIEISSKSANGKAEREKKKMQ